MSTFQIFLFACILLYSPIFPNSEQASINHHYPATANLSAIWNNNVSENRSLEFSDGSKVTIILLSGTPGYAFGFYCNGNCEMYLLAIFTSDPPADAYPQVVWSANPNNPVGVNSTLQLTSTGELVLKYVNGSLAWSTNTSGRSVVGLNLTEMGNLVLFGSNGLPVWQSFNQPTDCLVPEQALGRQEGLTASVSLSNWTQRDISLVVTPTGIGAYIGSNPSQVYFFYPFEKLTSIRLTNGSLAFYSYSPTPSDRVNIPRPTSDRYYMKLDYDGHLKVFELREKWTMLADITALKGLHDCDYPMVCGENGICTNGQCTCPTSTVDYFKQIDSRQPNLGCSPVTPLTCDAANDHKLLDLDKVTYFNFEDNFNVDRSDTNIDRCKEKCLEDCSCKAMIFRIENDYSSGECYLSTHIFSLKKTNNTTNDVILSIKVQVAKGENSHLAPVLIPAIGTLVLAIGIGISVFMIKKKRKALRDEIEEDYLDQVSGMSTRFSFEELKNATENFNRKLGEGGFGSVFQGILPNGNEIAVKCLDGVGQVKKSFLAEVETIGSIHHVNLVRLIGFCADKSHRLLVYEYMKNGSLDKWIYEAKNASAPLDWKCRKKIILDIAKGLSYLHQDCRQKIVHMDIKPQNILLDEYFNAKLSDFGLSKLVDKNHSLVVTRMRGTPGYLAPEWISSVITEKVDVYSFGIVILEILCGRRNYEKNEPEEERHLLNLFKMKAEEGRWLDMIDKQSEEMQSHGEEVVEMMQLAIWCLQGFYFKRPSMSMVINVLEGVKDVKRDLGYDFLSPQILINGIPVQVDSGDATPLLPSTLSGPR